MIDLGDQWPNLSVTTRDAAGVPGNATLVVLTITLPDGTSVLPVVTAAGSGVYTASYTPTQAGRHTARWVATGTNASAYAETLDVNEAAPRGIVSLTDVKAHLNITTTDQDDELQRFIDAATDFIEGKIGAVVRRSITETVTPDGSGSLWLSGPVISLTSMTSAYGYSASYLVASYTAESTGRVVPNYGITSYPWPVTVTYVGGRVIVPAGIRQAALDYVKWLWESQRGATALPIAGGEFEVSTPATVPYRILQALEPYMSPVVV